MGKLGRPKIKNPKHKSLGLRVSESEYMKLKAYAKEHKTTITQVLLSGWRLLSGGEQKNQNAL